MKSILDPTFPYTPSVKTNVAETFRRIRAELKAKAEQEARDQAERKLKVEIMRRRSA